MRCRRCNRVRNEVKERFERSSLVLEFAEYQKEKVKSKEEKKKAEQWENIESPDSSERRKARRKSVYIALVAFAVIVIIFIFAIRSASNETSPDNMLSQEADDIEPDNNDYISHTRDSIRQYVNMIGKQAPKGGEPRVSQDFLDNLDNVFVMGKTGTVEHEYGTGTGDTIVMMHWRSNEESTENDYTEFIPLLDEYCGSTGEKGHFDGDVAPESIRWVDPAYDLNIVAWLEGNRINLRWQVKDSQMAEIVSDMENLALDSSSSNQSQDMAFQNYGKLCDIVDETFLKYMAYFKMTYGEAGYNHNLSSRVVHDYYPIEEKVSFLNEECSIGHVYRMNPSANDPLLYIEIMNPLNSWDVDRLVNELERQLETKGTYEENDDTLKRYKIDIPGSEYSISVKKMNGENYSTILIYSRKRYGSHNEKMILSKSFLKPHGNS